MSGSANVILASQSPRRKQLLSYLLSEFTTQAADIDESTMPQESPQDYVERLALAKAKTLFDKQTTNTNLCVIGSDTSVVFNQHILGKPTDLNDCINMLSMLSGQTHQVYTAFSVLTPTQNITQTVVTDVVFDVIDKADMIDYWHTNEPQDKAGSYAIQGIGGQFVRRIQGSVSAVIGLPLAELKQVLKQVNII